MLLKLFRLELKNLIGCLPETKLKAIEKLDKFTVKIAYPDEWKDYSDLEIKAGNSYAENIWLFLNGVWKRILLKLVSQ